jgi:small nuclear ribonucleoprotein
MVNPLDTLQKSLNKQVLIKVKRNRVFAGLLRSFDIHMNVLMENCKYSYKVEDGEGKFKEMSEDFDQIVIRGDNIVFVEMSPQ